MARVLVVDDDPDSAAVLRVAFTMAGHDARAATSGEEALRLCESFAPDAAFVDLAMGGMNGYELAGKLKAMHPQTRVIAVTGVVPAYWRDDPNFETHLLKPISVPRALEMVATGSPAACDCAKIGQP